jgi:SAM-dependent methyltransferase
MSKQSTYGTVIKKPNMRVDRVAPIDRHWEKNFFARAEAIEKEQDKIYHNIIIPYIINAVSDVRSKSKDNISRILDVGCGCGYLTNKIHEVFSRRVNITGIDIISKEKIRRCKRKYPGIEFSKCNVYDFHSDEKFDLIVACLVAHVLPDIERFLSTIKNCLASDGSVILVMPHPCFWPFEKLNPKEFKYEVPHKHLYYREGYIHAWPYYHRPLEYYETVINRFGLAIKSEPIFRYETDGYTKKAFPHLLGMILNRFEAGGNRS